MIVLSYLVAFRERHFWSEVLGTSLGGSHPQVEARCRSQMLSSKVIYFDSMKNLTHAMKDMNITDSSKASVFYLDENFTSSSFQWLRRGLS